MQKIYSNIALIYKTLHRKTGIPAALYAIWSFLSIAFSCIALIVFPSIFCYIAAVVILITHGVLYFIYNTWTKTEDKLRVFAFATYKKLINYFAFLQFCAHSIILLLAWSKQIITSSTYTIVYWIMLIINALYLIIFFNLNSKKNLFDKGLYTTEKKNNKLVYVPVKLFNFSTKQDDESNRPSKIKAEQSGKSTDSSEPKLKNPVTLFLIKVSFFILSWVDAIIWAVSVVIFVNSLLFQLFEIPSESMVPELYVGSRVAAVRFLTNPEIPLSNTRIPITLGVKRFGQYVLSNPRYVLRKDQAINDFINDFLFKITFTLVRRPKVDENGIEIADPLIKRLIGMPGEQLTIIDDQVYIRNNVNEPFKPLLEDNQYAYTFKSRRSANVARIRYNIITESLRATIFNWDELKNSVNREYFDNLAKQYIDYFRTVKLTKTYSREYEDTYGFLFLAVNNIDERYFEAYTSILKSSPNRFISDLKDYLFAWENALPPENIYEENCLKANLLSKLLFLETLKQYIIQKESGQEQTEAFTKAQNSLHDYTLLYIRQFFDARNMPPFPENATLGKGQYFFMGDNRYNSLDCRHWSFESVEKLLYSKDPYSLRYFSNLHPFAIQSDRIRAIAVFSMF